MLWYIYHVTFSLVFCLWDQWASNCPIWWIGAPMQNFGPSSSFNNHISRQNTAKLKFLYPPRIKLNKYPPPQFWENKSLFLALEPQCGFLLRMLTYCTFYIHVYIKKKTNIRVGPKITSKPWDVPLSIQILETEVINEKIIKFFFCK